MGQGAATAMTPQGGRTPTGLLTSNVPSRRLRTKIQDFFTIVRTMEN